jgi:hypothetical protein
MSSRTDALTDDVVSALGVASITLPGGSTVTKPTGLTVERHRPTPIASSTAPGVFVYQMNELVETGPGRSVGRLAKRKLQLCVELRLDAAGVSADQALDTPRRWVVLAVCSDPRRSLLAHDTQEMGSEWDQADASSQLASLRTVFLIEYVTSASDIDAAT